MVDIAPSVSGIGQRLRAGREARGMSLDEVASTTRIPTRHLKALEQEDWDALPAPTYSVGFARAYGNAVGLNGPQIGQEVRALIGSGAPTTTAQNFYEPADPARVPPRSIAWITAAVALLLVAGYLIWRSQALGGDEVEQAIVAPEPAATPAVAARPATRSPAAPAGGPVVLTAVEDVWVRVAEADGSTRYAERTLKAGERLELPRDARAPELVTGRPNVLRVTVGGRELPPLGPAERRISDVSLRPADLLARAAGPAAAPAG